MKNDDGVSSFCLASALTAHTLRPYLNLSGTSGVAAYEIVPDCIRVQFRNSATVYVYSHERPGKRHVETMKELAAAGRGLATYISTHVKKDFARKE